MKFQRPQSVQPSAFSRQRPIRDPQSAIRNRERGVALVITVIMLSVITFLAITFLALARREKGVVATTKDMTLAKLAADSAIERAKAEMLAGILSRTNIANFNLLVSTNYTRWDGFNPVAQDDVKWDAFFPPAVNGFTNVNFEYLENGNPLTTLQYLQNLTNLFFNPRVPVFITNRAFANSGDFRYYLDLNRNGQHDRSGLWPVTNDIGQYLELDGTPTTVYSTSNIIWNYFTGDPEWVGELERPLFPHSGTNRFMSRYCYVVIPAGKTLDVNYIHNGALAGVAINSAGSDYFRNMGVGSWEINFAAFLRDLNTNNLFGWGGYSYDPILGFATGGSAFEDAAAVYRYRLNGNAINPAYSLNDVFTLYGAPGQTAFQTDLVDGYSDGNLVNTNSAGLPLDTDNAARQWSGDANPHHLFTTQDVFRDEVTKMGGVTFAMPDRLNALATNLSTYDRSTFYRMLSQLGTGSAFEDANKVHLNYVNVNGLSPTNFVAWDDLPYGPEMMFTNIATRLLDTYSREWRDTYFDHYTNTFAIGTNLMSVQNIPVWIDNNVTNRFVYKAQVHRLLQLAANVVDTTTNRTFAAGNILPSVFRPKFRRVGNDIFIIGYVEAGSDVAARNRRPLSLDNPAERALVVEDSNIYGVPWIIGAKKGLPNFNEFSSQTVFELTRKMQLQRAALTTEVKDYLTNIMYVTSVTNYFAAELWNSYASNYNRAITIVVTNEYSGQVVRDRGIAGLAYFSPVVYRTVGALTNITTWEGRGNKPAQVNPRSFIVPLDATLTIQPPAIVQFSPLAYTTNMLTPYERNDAKVFRVPKFEFFVTNRFRAYAVDSSTGRILDYVQFEPMVQVQDISADLGSQTPQEQNIAEGGTAGGQPFEALWNTNRSGGGNSTLTPTLGMIKQFEISLDGNTASLWQDYGDLNTGQISFFRSFLGIDPKSGNQKLVQQYPFDPSVRVVRSKKYEVNDPLVHYLADDLTDMERESSVDRFTKRTKPARLPGIREVNYRYQPWGGKEGQGSVPLEDFDLAVKDPGVRNSDSWEFHTNAFPNIGWLGRVHRGTPWQTVYLKSDDVGIANLSVPQANNPLFNWLFVHTNAQGRLAAQRWQSWSGNPNITNSYFTRPASDRLLFDVFTTAFNENAARGQLPVNQEGLAAWSAVLGGVVAISNNAVVPRIKPSFAPLTIQPAGVYDPFDATKFPAMLRIVNGINATRANTGLFPSQSFRHVGDVLATPELTVNSPFLNRSTLEQQQFGLNDSAYEWLPQQIMSLLRLGEPRFVIYAYGQALAPADNSVQTASGAYFGLCTNYQITAEVAARAVVRVEGSPNPAEANNANPKLRYPPRLVVESYNVLGPE